MPPLSVYSLKITLFYCQALSKCWEHTIKMPDKVPLTGLNFLIQRSLTFKQKTKFWFGFKTKTKKSGFSLHLKLTHFFQERDKRLPQHTATTPPNPPSSKWAPSETHLSFFSWVLTRLQQNNVSLWSIFSNRQE